MAKERIVMITTSDNPYDPFTQFTDWLNYDMTHSYNTCGLLARFYDEDSDASDEEKEIAKEDAIDRIIKNDFQNLYIKVVKEVEPNQFDSKCIR